MTDPRPTLAEPDDDPYLWLEDIEGDAACAWADAQSATTMGRLGDTGWEGSAAALTAILDRPDRIPFVTRRAEWLYNFWRDDRNKRGIWRRTSMESYRSEKPDWDVLLDLDLLAEREGEDWVWQGASTLAPLHERAILRLSRGGSDAVVLREFDLGERGFVAGGFVAPEAKGGVAWLDRDTLLLSSALGAGNATDSGYARTVRLWARGSDPLAAPVLFEVPAGSMGCWGSYDRESDWLIFIEKTDFYRHVFWIGDRTGPRTRVDLPADAAAAYQRGQLAVRLRSAWDVGGAAHAADTVLGIGLARFLAGARDFRALFAPGRRQAVQGFFWCGGQVVISVLDDLAPLFLRADPLRDWVVEPIPGLPAIGTVSVWSLDAETEDSTGELLAMAQTPVEPPALMLLSPGLAAPALLRRSPAVFDPRGAIVTRHVAVAEDGERIPYVQTGPAGETGEAPVHLSGYGGFRVSRLPVYSATIGKLWVERGGTSVVANIRGGGEFGTWWHEAGRRAGKRASHDDFAAVARDLVRRGVTRPGRIAAEGGSNGGLLIANMLTRHPGDFGALFCTIPLVDMRRYHRLLAGASWVAEYGDPDKAEDWAFLGPLSAYHAAEAGRAYPPILIATSRRDDRVHPGHARKFAAKLQALGYDALFYEPAAGGHGYGKDNAEVARFSALGLAFLRRAIGWAG